MIFRRLGAAMVAGLLAASSALPACSTTANVSDVWLSIDDDGSRRRDVFFTDSTAVVCVAEVGVGRKDVTVEMLIRRIRGAPYGTRDFAPENTVVVATDVHPEVTRGKPGKLFLKLTATKVVDGKREEASDAPFTPGSYVCEVRLDGELQRSAAFNIDYPDCPTVAITQDQPCVGFYPLDPVTFCPRAGLTGDPTPACACTPKGWDCPK